MQSHNCNLCNYSTTKLSNLERHNESKKHIKNANEYDKKNSGGTIVSRGVSIALKNAEVVSQNLEVGSRVQARQYICDYCGDTFKHRQSRYNHMNGRCKMMLGESDEDDDFIKHPVKSDIVGVLEDMENRIVKKLAEQIKNSQTGEKSDIITLAKSTAEVAKSTADTANKQTSLLKYAMKNLNKAPPLKKLGRAEAIKLITYEPDGKKSDHTIEEHIIFKFKKHLLVDFIGDIIVDFYQTDNPKNQSVWGTDISRLKFIIKEQVGDTEKSEWIKDDGVRIMTYIIKPLCNEICNIMIKHIKQINKTIKNNDELTHVELSKLMEQQRNSLEAQQFANTNKIFKSILKYVAPHFGLNMTQTMIETYSSPESD